MNVFLADLTGFSGQIIPLVVVSLSMTIPIVAIVTDHLQKKERMRLMEKAIEHGADLENFSVEEPEKPRLPYRTGMVTLAVGVGILIGSRFVNFGYSELDSVMRVGGAIAICVSLALLLNDWMNRERFKTQ